MKWLNDFLTSAKGKLRQYNNSAFKDAAMAAAALMTVADGKVDQAEVDSVAKLIAVNETLSVFPAEELGELYRSNCAKASDPFARLDLIKKLSGVSKVPGAGDMIARIAIIIANQDGNFADSEKKVFKSDICNPLSLNPEDYLS